MGTWVHEYLGAEARNLVGPPFKGAPIKTARRAYCAKEHACHRERLGPGFVVVNGPHELSFSPSGGRSPDYLLFLKKDADGSFSPVSGHTFPGEGVFSLHQPL